MHRIDAIASIDRVNMDNLDQVLSAHYMLLSLLKQATGIEKRSLVSKYLHFHSPKSVFIYDSIANKELRSRMKGKRFKLSTPFDNEYAAFCYRAIHYPDNTFENTIGALSTPRRLDMELLSYGS